jgi:hypothetical protein
VSQDEGPVVDCCEHSNEPLGSIKAGNFLTNCVTNSFSGRTLLNGVCYNTEISNCFLF